MECRAHCGACCIEPSIQRPYFGMPNGKRAGEICTHLDFEHYQCKIWQTNDYPAVCQGFKAEPDICGTSREEAMETIRILEVTTQG